MKFLNLFVAAAIALLASGIGFTMLTATVGCGASPGKVAVDIGAGISVAACVLQHNGEPVTQILIDCAGATEAGVTTILSEHRAAMAREMSSKDGGTFIPYAGYADGGPAPLGFVVRFEMADSGKLSDGGKR